MIFWYKLITYLIYPFAHSYLILRLLKKKESPERYREKLSKIKAQRGEGFLIWFHVASVGEAMSILPLIEKYTQEQKVNKILITSITLSSGKIFGSEGLAINMSVYIDEIETEFLPLNCNWIASNLLPKYDEQNQTFLEPFLPNTKIGIMHLAAGIWKDGKDISSDDILLQVIKTFKWDEQEFLLYINDPVTKEKLII